MRICWSLVILSIWDRWHSDAVSLLTVGSTNEAEWCPWGVDYRHWRCSKKQWLLILFTWKRDGTNDLLFHLILKKKLKKIGVNLGTFQKLWAYSQLFFFWYWCVTHVGRLEYIYVGVFSYCVLNVCMYSGYNLKCIIFQVPTKILLMYSFSILYF